MAKPITMEELRKQSRTPSRDDWKIMKEYDNISGKNTSSQYDDLYVTDWNPTKRGDIEKLRPNTMYSASMFATPDATNVDKDISYEAKEQDPIKNPDNFLAFVDGEWVQYTSDMKNVYLKPKVELSSDRESDVSNILNTMTKYGKINSDSLSIDINDSYNIKKQVKEMSPMSASNYYSTKPRYENKNNKGYIHDLIAERLRESFKEDESINNLFLNESVQGLLLESAADIKEGRSRYLPYEWETLDDDEFDY